MVVEILLSDNFLVKIYMYTNSCAYATVVLYFISTAINVNKICVLNLLTDAFPFTNSDSKIIKPTI